MVDISRRDFVKLSTAVAAMAALPLDKITPVEIWPDGWLPCDGRSLCQHKFAELFRVIGETYGGGAGYFNLPELRGKIALNAAPIETGGSAFGNPIHELTYIVSTRSKGVPSPNGYAATLPAGYIVAFLPGATT